MAATKKVSSKKTRIRTPKNSVKTKTKISSPVRSEKSMPAPALNKKIKKRKISLYHKIAFSFIFLTLALLAIIFYFSFVKVSITIMPKSERISGDLVANIYDKDKAGVKGEQAIAGVVRQTEVSETKTYAATGTETLGEEVTGKVTIINNYNRSQPLVATTRLLSADNKLYRIKNTINVPAGGSVEVEVYADEPGADKAIGPSKFTVPGLWAGLQDRIYGESQEGFVYNESVKKHITQEDIDQASRDLRQALVDKVKEEIGRQFGAGQAAVYEIDDNSVAREVDGNVGEEKDNFSVSMTTNVIVIAFPREAMNNLAREKLLTLMPANKDLINFNDNNIVYALKSQNVSQGLAEIKASFVGEVILKKDADIIKAEKLLGLSKEQLNSYLKSIPEIESFEVNFTPAWVERVPNLSDRVKIKIKE